MKTLSELRELFIGARNIAMEASPARVEEAARLLEGISEHAKELFETETSYIEKAKARNLYESLDNIIALLRARGFCNEYVAAFFGLAGATGPSFADVASGKSTIKKPDVTEPPKSAPAASSPLARIMAGLGSEAPAPAAAAPAPSAPIVPPAPPAAPAVNAVPPAPVAEAPVVPPAPPAAQPPVAEAPAAPTLPETPAPRCDFAPGDPPGRFRGHCDFDPRKRPRGQNSSAGISTAVIMSLIWPISFGPNRGRTCIGSVLK
jgi:hypothetical protein